MPPQTNSQLVQISADGSSEDYDSPAGGGSAIWIGATQAYVIEKVRTNYSQDAGGLTKSKDLQIILDAPFVRAYGINTGHILTFTWRNQTHSRRVMEYSGADMAGVPNYVRFHLNPEPLEIALESE